MISLAVPWALAGLVALPAIVWLHRRRRRPVVVTVPSVLFLDGDDVPADAPQRRRFDAEMLLSLAAAALLALAAAGPALRREGGRVVRIVVDNGPAMDATPEFREPVGARASRAYAEIRDLAGPHDRVDSMPGRGGPARLLALARAGDADLRVVVTDRRIVPEPTDVRVVCVGDSASANVGIVAASVEERPGGWRLFANVMSPGFERIRVRLATWASNSPDLDLVGGGPRSVVLDFPGAVPASVRLGVDPGGDLRGDDHVNLERRPYLVAFATGALGYPDPYRRAVLDGLKAVVGDDLVVEKPIEAPENEAKYFFDLVVGEPEAIGTSEHQGIEVLSLRPVPAGAQGIHAAPGSVRTEWPLPEEGVVLDPTGCDLVFAPAPDGRRPDALFETLDHGIRFLPDPLAGTPAPVDHPIWPLFLDAVVSRTHGRAAAGGWRVQGLLDPEVTRLGRDVVPFDPAWLDAAPRRATEAPLRDAFLAAGAACLVLLWAGARWWRPGTVR